MLFLYLAVSEHSVSAVLVHEDDRKQSPIYYVNKALLDAKTRYSQLENLALAFITAARKLIPYFQSHPITVLTSFPLKNILHKPELSGRLTKWAVELSEHHIDYQPRLDHSGNRIKNRSDNLFKMASSLETGT